MNQKLEVMIAEPDPAQNTRLYSAIAATMGQLGTLAKANYNKFDNYPFASIDDFLAATSQACSDNGLVIIQQEKTLEPMEKKGKQWLKVVFLFRVFHVSGESLKPLKRTVAVPFTGAQSFGSAQSYALKQFMRSLFQISTGDRDDPDFGTDPGTKTQEAPINQPAKPAVTVVGNAQIDEMMELWPRDFVSLVHFDNWLRRLRNVTHTTLTREAAAKVINMLKSPFADWPETCQKALKDVEPESPAPTEPETIPPEPESGPRADISKDDHSAMLADLNAYAAEVAKKDTVTELQQFAEKSISQFMDDYNHLDATPVAQYLDLLRKTVSDRNEALLGEDNE